MLKAGAPASNISLDSSDTSLVAGAVFVSSNAALVARNEAQLTSQMPWRRVTRRRQLTAAAACAEAVALLLCRGIGWLVEIIHSDAGELRRGIHCVANLDRDAKHGGWSNAPGMQDFGA